MADRLITDSRVNPLEVEDHEAHERVNGRVREIERTIHGEPDPQPWTTGAHDAIRNSKGVR